MLRPVGPSAPASPDQPGDAPTTAIFNAMTAFWAVFHEYSGRVGPNNTPQYLSMLAQATKNLIAAWPSGGPTDQYSKAIYNDLTTPLFTYQGEPISLLTLSQESNPANLIADMGADFSVISSDVFSHLLGSGVGTGDIDDWYNAWYPHGDGEPSPTPPTDLKTAFDTLVSDMKAGNVSAIATDIVNVYNSLTGASSLDGYGQFLLNYLEASLDAKGSVSLYSMAKAGDTTDLEAWLTKPPALPSPFSQQEPIQGQFANWVQEMIQKYELSE